MSTASEPREKLLQLGARVAELRQQQLKISEELANVESQHASVIEGLTGKKRDGRGAKPKKNGADEQQEAPVTAVAKRGRKPGSKNGAEASELRNIVLRAARSIDSEEGFTIEDLSEKIPKKDREAILISLRDMRARLGWFDKPGRGVWRLSAEGQEAADALKNKSS